jgi:S1-C subfamily serine protease
MFAETSGKRRYVAGTTTRGTAATAGIKVGDVISPPQEGDIHHRCSLVDLLDAEAKATGRNVAPEHQDGRRTTPTVTLGEYPGQGRR